MFLWAHFSNLGWLGGTWCGAHKCKLFLGWILMFVVARQQEERWFRSPWCPKMAQKSTLSNFNQNHIFLSLGHVLHRMTSNFLIFKIFWLLWQPKDGYVLSPKSSLLDPIINFLELQPNSLIFILRQCATWNDSQSFYFEHFPVAMATKQWMFGFKNHQDRKTIFGRITARDREQVFAESHSFLPISLAAQHVNIHKICGC